MLWLSGCENFSGPAIERRSSHLHEHLWRYYFRTRNIAIFLSLVYLCCLRVVATPQPFWRPVTDRVYWTCLWFFYLLHSEETPSDNGENATHRFHVFLTLSSSRASSLTAGFTATGPPTKLSVGVLHRVSPAGDDGLLSNCKCDGTAVNGGSSGLSSTLATSSESTTRMKASQGKGWYKRQLNVPLLGQTFKFSILTAFPRLYFSW